MGIERRQHAVDRRLDQFFVIGLLDIAVAHLVEHFAEDRELVVAGARGGAQRVVRSAHKEHAGGGSIGKVGESFPHRTTLGSLHSVRLHQFGLAAPAWPGSDGAAGAAAGGSVFAGAASALTAGSGCFTPCKRSTAATS